MDKSIIPFSPKNAGVGCMVGIELVLNERKKLNNVKFYITDYGEPSAPFSIRIFLFDDLNQPHGEIYLENFINYSLTGGVHWIIANLEEEDIFLDKGKYLIAMKWLLEPGPEGLTAQTIGFRESNVSEPKSWMNWLGERHHWKKDTGPYRGNFMIKTEFTTT